MGNRLGGEGAGAGAVIGFITGGPLGAVIGAAAGGVGGHIVEEVGRPIEESIKTKTANKSPVTLLDNHCVKSWSIGDFIDQYEGIEHAVIGEHRARMICGIKFSNFVPISKLKRIRYDGGYDEYNEGYTCGLNAINMSLRIWGYDKQMALSEYSYKYPVIDAQSARWGLTGQEMYDYNIKNTFDYAPDPSWEECTVVGTPGLDIGYIDNTDYTSYTVMLVSGTGTSGHYILIIGVSEDKSYYLVTDQSRKIWLMSYSTMRDQNMFYYRSNAGYSVMDVRSYYRMG